MTTATISPVVAPRADGLQYRQRMDDALRDAIERTDLPGLVGRYYPDSGARPGRKEVVFAVWRGDEHESFSLFRGDGGTWLYRDHRTRETGNAFGFLTDICGLSPKPRLPNNSRRVPVRNRSRPYDSLPLSANVKPRSKRVTPFTRRSGGR